MPDELTDQTRTAYDVVARAYAAAVPDTSFESADDLELVKQFALGLAESPAAGNGTRVLDAGCGAGRMIPLLLTHAPSLAVDGIDLSAEMIALARAAHPGIPFAQGSLSELPYEAERFDGVLAWYSIIHTPPHQLTGILAEFHRVLRPGGLLLLAYQAGIGERQIARPYGHDVELRAFLHDTDFIEANLDDLGFDTVHRVDRDPRTNEHNPQGFIIARRD